MGHCTCWGANRWRHGSVGRCTCWFGVLSVQGAAPQGAAPPREGRCICAGRSFTCTEWRCVCTGSASLRLRRTASPLRRLRSGRRARRRCSCRRGPARRRRCWRASCSATASGDLRNREVKVKVEVSQDERPLQSVKISFLFHDQSFFQLFARSVFGLFFLSSLFYSFCNFLWCRSLAITNLSFLFFTQKSKTVEERGKSTQKKRNRTMNKGWGCAGLVSLQ